MPERRKPALQTSIRADAATPIAMPRRTKPRISGIRPVRAGARHIADAPTDADVSYPHECAEKPEDRQDIRCRDGNGRGGKGPGRQERLMQDVMDRAAARPE